MIEYFIISLLPNVLLVGAFFYIWFVRQNSKHREELLNKTKNNRVRNFYQKAFSDKTFFVLAAIVATTAVLDAVFDGYEAFYKPHIIFTVANTFLELAAFGIVVYLVIRLLKSYKS